MRQPLTEGRIVQRKKSMKVTNRLGRFPMEEEHETGKNGEAWHGRVQIRMQNAESLSRDQIQEFLRSSEPIEFSSGRGRDERYLW